MTLSEKVTATIRRAVPAAEFVFYTGGEGIDVYWKRRIADEPVLVHQRFATFRSLSCWARAMVRG